MRDLIDGADYLATEIGVMLHLCEWIDRGSEAGMEDAFPILHAVMRKQIDDLAEVINQMAGKAAPPP